MKRFRHLRATQKLRDEHAEIKLSVNDLILPFFVTTGKSKAGLIPGFGGVRRHTKDTLIDAVENAMEKGIYKVLIFGVVDPVYKNENGSFGLSGYGPVEEAVSTLKRLYPGLIVMTDVCLCAYTDHGHCGIIKNGIIDNDSTLKVLSQMAVNHAKSGADFVAPSAMMDGQVGSIRKALDKAGYGVTRILAYSAKYASSFYGPFRNAANSTPAFGDRKTYQMDYRNIKQAMEEIRADLNEGADTVMIKPASHYLDVIRQARNEFKNAKIAAYQVSGEYMMIKLASGKKLMDEKQAILESLTCIKRAGADSIITYFAQEAAQWL
jgi:porphobilinogen synthase